MLGFFIWASVILLCLFIIFLCWALELNADNYRLKEKMAREEGSLRRIFNLPKGEFERADNEPCQAVVIVTKLENEDEELFKGLCIGVCSPLPIPNRFRIEKPGLYNRIVENQINRC